MKIRMTENGLENVGAFCSWDNDDGGQDVTTQQTSNAPWSPQQAPLKRGFEAAGGVLDNPTSFYGGQTYADYDPATQQALSGTQQMAQQGNPLVQQAQGLAGQTMGGDFLEGGNPAFQGMVDRATQPMVSNFQNNIVPSINAGASAGGRFNSGVARQAALGDQAEILNRGIGDIASGLAYQDYQGERGFQNQAMGAAPGLQEAGYGQFGKLAGVGASRELQSQRGIDESQARHEFGQMSEGNDLARYMSLIGGGYGMEGSQTTHSPRQQSNPLMQLLGGGMAAGSFFL